MPNLVNETPRGWALPGIANLHSHAFQRAMAGLSESRGPHPRDTFWTWRRLMYRFLDQLAPEDVQAITAFVPLSNMFGYTTDLRSMTQGRAMSSMEFDHYAPLPQSLANEFVAKANRD